MAEKKKYKIVYDRNGCIGAFACVAVLPHRWGVAEDSKADLIGGKLEGQNFVLELELTPEELELEIDAARVCPVNVIHIYDEQGNTVV